MNREEVLRHNRENLANMITMETGKTLAEGRNEVQEMTCILNAACDNYRKAYVVVM